MQIAGADVWPKAILKIFTVTLIFWSASLAQAPAGSAVKPASATGFYDPLPQDTGEAGLKLELRKLQTTGRLMMVVAHPDDEDGGLLTREARGKGIQTLLMTLTRGEGGQNETGSTFSDQLGILRTLELLASDRYYGVEQRFSRVADFGYSKTADETFQKWGGHDVPLADIVRVIREFRPDVLIARFSGTERDGHGHHQASSMLTQEAFRAAADPNRFPDQIKEGLQPWQPKKLYVGNVCGFGATNCADQNYTVQLNTGEVDPVLGMSYVQFAIEGLKHQTSQGLGDISVPSGPRYAFYKLVDSVVPSTKDEKGHEKDLFDGIDTSLSGLAQRINQEAKRNDPSLDQPMKDILGEIKLAEENLGKEPSATAGPLLKASAALTSAEASLHDFSSALLDEKDRELALAISLALNVSLHAEIAPSDADLAKNEAHAAAFPPGSKLKLTTTLDNGSNYPMFIVAGDGGYSGGCGADKLINHSDYRAVPVGAGTSGAVSELVGVPNDAQYTRPYWHRADPARESVNTIDNEGCATLPLPPPAFHAGATYTLNQSAQAALLGSSWGKRKHGISTGIDATVLSPYLTPLAIERMIPSSVLPIFSLAIDPVQQALPLSDGREISVVVRVSSILAGAPDGTLHLDLPGGWRSEPSNVAVSIPKRDETQNHPFRIFPANLVGGRAEIHAVLDSGGKKYSEGYTLVTREDLGSFYYFQPAVQHISVVDVKVPKDLKVGYIMGAGDDIPTVLKQIGMDVTLIPADKLASESLSQYGTIVLGVRAYETHKEIVANNKKLLDFVSNGGTLIVQNNNSTGDFNSGHFTPYDAELSRARVSVEEAPVQILAPDDPVFHYPNEISQKDFDGWVQERGLYFMDKWDDHFKPLLSCHDPGEPDQKGGMIEAKYGKGTYIYTGYAFFRQLPAGVPGAIRLLVNLVSAGHQR